MPVQNEHPTHENSGKSAKSPRLINLRGEGGLPHPEDAAHGPAYDPFGIYGTRSAQRIRAARTRRIVQKFAVLAVVITLFAMGVGVVFSPPVSLIKGVRLGMAAVPSAMPVAASDKDGTVLLSPGEGGELLRFDLQNGTAISCLNTDFPLRASPLVLGNVAFVPSENGVLTALDWRRGKVLWQRPTGAPLTARPTIIQWQTIVQRIVAPVPTAAPVPLDNVAGAAEKPVAAPLTESVTKTQKLIVIGNDAGTVAGLNTGNGKVIWSRRTGAPVGNGIVSLLLPNKAPRVLVPLLQGAGSPGALWCLEGKTGAVLWKYPASSSAPSPQVAPPAVDKETGQVFCADDSGTLSCLDGKTGRKIWKKFALPKNPRSKELVLLRGEPLFRRYDFGAIVVLGGNDGIVRCFAADNGLLLWQFDAEAPVRARPLPLVQNLPHSSGTRELLLIGCDSSLLPVLDPQSGRPILHLRASDAAPFGVVPVGDQLCTVTTSGVVEEFVF